MHAAEARTLPISVSALPPVDLFFVADQKGQATVLLHARRNGQFLPAGPRSSCLWTAVGALGSIFPGHPEAEQNKTEPRSVVIFLNLQQGN